jgi:hypothetical protein
MDWSTREATETLRAEREAAFAREENVRKERLKDVCGKELFEQLHAWLAGQAQSFNEQTQRQVIKVEEIKLFGGMDSHYFFRALDSGGIRLPMRVSDNPISHTISVECEAGQRHYPLVVDTNGNVRLQTARHEAITVEQLGEELMNHWRSSQF